MVLVGHSIAFVLLKYLSEEAVEKPIAGLFLIAALLRRDRGLAGRRGCAARGLRLETSRRAPVFLYHSRDDEVPYAHLALYAEKLPQATIHEFDGRGHQFDGDLSAVARDIKEL